VESRFPNKVPRSKSPRAKRHALTPFFLIMQDETQFAVVIAPPEHAFVENGNNPRLAIAVMTLDVTAILSGGLPPALA